MRDKDYCSICGAVKKGRKFANDFLETPVSLAARARFFLAKNICESGPQSGKFSLLQCDFITILQQDMPAGDTMRKETQ
jgi:hypothetical protein